VELIVIQKLEDFIAKLTIQDKAKLTGTFLLFKEYGRTLPVKYLKRITGTKDLWELRAKKIRIFVAMYGNTGIAVHGIMKQSQKTPKQDIDLAVKRAARAKEDLL